MKRIIGLLTILLTSCLFLTVPVFAQDGPNFSARVHIQDYGWRDVNSDENHHIILGTMGEAKRIEAFEITMNYPNLGIQYEAHVQDIGWQGLRNGPERAGTEGQSKQIEAMSFQLTGENAALFDIFYRAHVQNYGWLDWAANGQRCGTSNHFFRCEAVEIVIYPKGTPAPGGTKNPLIHATTRLESQHIYLVNQCRKQHGLDYISGNDTLKAVADYRLMELPVSTSHVRPNGKQYETVVKDRFPNYPGEGGGIIESFVYGSKRFQEPAASFNCYMAYPHMTDIMLDPGAKYMSWSAITSGNMGYSIELFSGLDTIDFDR